MAQLLSRLVLPDGADIENAWTDVVDITPPGAALGGYFKDDSAVYSVPSVVRAQIITDATAGNRNVYLQIYDEQGRAFITIPQAAVQGPSSSIFWTWTTAASQSYLTGQFGLAVLPEVVLLPGYQIGAEWSPLGPGDRIISEKVTMIKIPTGPRGRRDADVALLETPAFA